MPAGLIFSSSVLQDDIARTASSRLGRIYFDFMLPGIFYSHFQGCFVTGGELAEAAGGPDIELSEEFHPVPGECGVETDAPVYVPVLIVELVIIAQEQAEIPGTGAGQQVDAEAECDGRRLGVSRIGEPLVFLLDFIFIVMDVTHAQAHVEM